MTDIPHRPGALAGRGLGASRASEVVAALQASRWTPRAALTAVVAFAAAFNLWQISGNGYGNTFYAAAVRSATVSWKNWFFGSFDPGGFITVDKPPVFLWFGGLAARIFGYSSWTLLAPSAIAGAITVGLVWWMVRRYFGAFAATIAAVALILTPISVAVDRLNLPEPFYILALVGAVAAILRSLESRRWWAWTLLAGALVGVAFNTKMLAGWIPGPALALALVVGAGDSWRRPAIKRILLSLAVLAAATFVVSFSWMVVVDAWPASSRPYIGGSTNNTVSNLAFDYNGLGRVEGENRGGGAGRGGFPGGGRNFTRPNSANGGGFPGNFFGNGGGGTGGGSAPNSTGGAGSGGGGVPGFNTSPGSGGTSSNGGTFRSTRRSTQAGPGGSSPNGSGNGSNNGTPNGFPAGGIPRGGFGNATGAGGIIAGAPGLWRMFDDANGGQIAWLLPFALLGSIACFWYWRRDRVRRSAVVAFAGWVLLFGLVFSFAKGTYHSYYTSALAPGIAALVGMTAVAFIGLFKQNRLWIIPFCGIVAVTIAVQLGISGRFNGFEYGVRPYVIPLVVTGVLLLAAALAVQRIPKAVGMSWVLAGLLLIPAAWSQFEVTHASTNTTLPQAGPRQGAAGLTFGSAAFDDGTASLAQWLLAHREPGTKWDLAVTSSQNASTLIAEYNLSVMSIGGFMGSDPTITASQFATMVEKGEVRYVEAGGRGGFGGGGFGGFGSSSTSTAKGASAVMAAVESACSPVTDSTLPQQDQGSIYDCSGAAAKIRAASSGSANQGGAS